MTHFMQIKFNEPVWHDKPYQHPQLHTEVIPDFYDRTDLKTQLRRRLVAGPSRVTVIQGERRSGKTSLLRLLEHDLKLKAGSDILPLWLPWQGVESRDSLVDELLESCAFELDLEIPFFVPARSATNEIVVAALRQLTTDSGKTIVIFLDEFDSVIEQSTTVEGEAILELIHTLVSAEDLPFILVMTLVRLPDLPADHALSQSDIFALTPFPEEDLAKMAMTLLASPGTKTDPVLLSNLYELSGGWPYFAKLLLLYLADQEGSVWDLDLALAAALEHPLMERSMEHIYTRHFTLSEQKAILALVLASGQLSAASVQAEGEEMQMAVSNLVRRHFLKNLPGDEIRFQIGLLNHWFPQWIRFQEEVEKHIKPDIATGNIHPHKQPDQAQPF